MTKTQIVYAALDGALTGPSTDPRRTSNKPEERLEYLTDAVISALASKERQYEDVDLGYTLFCAMRDARCGARPVRLDRLPGQRPLHPAGCGVPEAARAGSTMTRRGISKMAEYTHEQRAVPRQRSSYERMYVPLVKSQPPLRAWGPHVATAIGGIVLLVIVIFALKIITTL